MAARGSAAPRARRVRSGHSRGVRLPDRVRELVGDFRRLPGITLRSQLLSGAYDCSLWGKILVGGGCWVVCQSHCRFSMLKVPSKAQRSRNTSYIFTYMYAGCMITRHPYVRILCRQAKPPKKASSVVARGITQSFSWLAVSLTLCMA